MAVIIFISFKLSLAEYRYYTTEREALAILKYVEETRYLIKGN